MGGGGNLGTGISSGGLCTLQYTSTTSGTLSIIATNTSTDTVSSNTSNTITLTTTNPTTTITDDCTTTNYFTGGGTSTAGIQLNYTNGKVQYNRVTISSNSTVILQLKYGCLGSLTIGFGDSSKNFKYTLPSEVYQYINSGDQSSNSNFSTLTLTVNNGVVTASINGYTFTTAYTDTTPVYLTFNKGGNCNLVLRSISITQ